jgi:hypothetical protein
MSRPESENGADGYAGGYPYTHARPLAVRSTPSHPSPLPEPRAPAGVSVGGRAGVWRRRPLMRGHRIAAHAT